jgi:hypothetical protein
MGLNMTEYHWTFMLWVSVSQSLNQVIFSIIPQYKVKLLPMLDIAMDGGRISGLANMLRNFPYKAIPPVKMAV